MDDILERWKLYCDICGLPEEQMVNLLQSVHSHVPAPEEYKHCWVSDVCLECCSHHTWEEIEQAIDKIYERRKNAASKHLKNVTNKNNK